MTADGPSAIAVTALFCVVLGYSVVRAWLTRSWVDRVSNVAHAAMSLVMIAMPWSWYAVFPVAAQIVVFSAATFWYAYLALFRPHAHAAPQLGHHFSPAVLWYHAFMMASMVWMAVAMSPLTTGSDMSGMEMSGSDAAMTGALPGAVVVSVACGIVFVVATVWFLAVMVRDAVGADALGAALWPHLGDLLAAALMAAGMACAFLLLMTP